MGTALGRLGRGAAGLTAWVSLPAVAAVLLWSLVIPSAKFGLGEFPVMAFVALRPLIAGALLLSVLRARGLPVAVARADWPRLAAAGVAGMALFQLATFVGVRLTSATHSILLGAASPLVAAGLLWVTGRRPNRVQLAGLLLGFAGVVALVARSGGERGLGGTTVEGDLLVLLGTLGWVGVTALPRGLVGTYGAWTVTGWLALISGLALLPFAVGDIVETVVRPPSVAAWLSMLYSATLGMIVATALWQRAAQTLGPTRTLAYAYLEPPIAVFVAAAMLGEGLDPVQILVAVVLLVGVGLAQRG